MQRLRIVFVLTAFVLIGRGASAAQAPQAPQGALTTIEVKAESLQGNLLGIPLVQRVEVYLPPGYAEGQAFPVLYLLHGIGGSSADWTREQRILRAVDAAVNSGRVGPMIVVMPTAMTPYGGSFYVNSTVNGRWLDFLSGELVTAVDQSFKTDPRPARRGVAGHSMGGYGALMLSMSRPDVFGSTYAMAPCCLSLTDDLSASNPSWKKLAGAPTAPELIRELRAGDMYPMSFVAMAAVFSPNPANAPLFVDLPFETSGTVAPRPDVIARWHAMMPVHLVESRLDALRQLDGIAIDYGLSEQFPHIPAGSRAYSAALVRHGIPHLLEAYDGDHRNRVWERLDTRVLPFFSTLFKARREER